MPGDECQLGKWGSGQKGKRVVACETMEEEEHWSETWERYHGKCGETFREKTTVWWWVKRKVMDKTEREGVCIVKGVGDRKRKDGGEQLCSSWHLHRQHLGKPSITEVRLIDFSPPFNQHFTGRPSLSLECKLMLTQLPVFYFSHQDQTATVKSTVLEQQAINKLGGKMKICSCHNTKGNVEVLFAKDIRTVLWTNCGTVFEWNTFHIE